MAKIHESLVKVMRDVGAIAKDTKNQEQGYNYRSAEAVYNRVQPLFATHGIVSVPRVVEQIREQGSSKRGTILHYAILTVEYTFFAEDGSSVVVTVVGEGMDSGDKASNKAMTAAHKYAICQVLNIPYQVHDPDASTPEWSRRLSGLVTLRDLNELKQGFARAYPDEPKEQLATHFVEWVAETTGREFNPADFRHWTADDMEKCRAKLTPATK